jgi:predicted RNA-binding protein YlqC (UPF0109 family)
VVIKLLKSIFGGEDGAGNSAVSDEINDLENFVDYVVKSLVDAPEEVHITTEEGEDSSIIRINCRKDDIGKIVGKSGKTIMAIRSLVSSAAGRLRKRVSVEVVD